MRFCYGDKNSIRILEEAEFWKRQEAEHTDVIREIVPDLEPYFVERLAESKEVFNATEATILQYIESIIRSKDIITPDREQEIIQLIDITLYQSKMFVAFLGRMIRESAAVSDNPMAIIVINHIRRESEYYIGIATAYLRSQ